MLVAALAVCALALLGAAGWVDRRRAPGEAYTLFLSDFASHAPEAITAFLLFAALYTACAAALRAAASRPVPATARGREPRPTAARLERTTTWLCGRWWRLSALLAVAWAPLLLMQLPGTSNPDFHLAVIEVLGDRATLEYPPFDVYPIAHHLVPDGDVLVSTHHNAFLTWLSGTLMGASLDLTGSFMWAFCLLTGSQAVFTIVAFGRALELLARHAPRTSFRALAVLCAIAGGWPIAMWSLALAKNPLFAAALVWWVAVCIDAVLSSRPVSARRLVGWACLTLVLLCSAKYGVYIVLAQLLLLIVLRRGRRRWAETLTALALPIVITEALLRGLIAGGFVIPNDPMEAKSLQIQSLGLVLQQDPEALTPEERSSLSPIFDPDAMSRDFDPDFVRPLRSSGYIDGAYRWRTVTQEEAAAFDGIWAAVAAREPLLVTDSVIRGAFRFFDPLSRGFDNWPRADADDGIQAVPIDGHHFGDDGRNDAARDALTATTAHVESLPGIRLLLEPSVRVVLVLLLAAAAIAARVRAAWVWALPLILHCGVLIAAPLAASGRYSLGIVYALPVAILALGIEGRGRSPSEAPQPALSAL
ncbi:DUF6020 family protein [Microbacterium sp. gxy059]|uniref:DUF6020 family protein n=1 Tax=Microbacterium sp. gxy059 TaxID=2957199 RepID=UPI003D996540